jgi:predicted glycosyltransferase
VNIWVDMENAPHVLVLRPIIEELLKLGHKVFLTARDFGQTVQLLELYQMKAQVFGKQGNKSRFIKIFQTVLRSLRLYSYACAKNIDLSLCPGSRSMIMSSRLLGIPVIVFDDYEYSYMPSWMLKWITKLYVPSVMSLNSYLSRNLDARKIVRYPGLKEDLYVHGYKPDKGLLSELGIDSKNIVALMRPPATTAHYHVHEGDKLFWNALKYLSKRTDVSIIIIPRNPDQHEEIENWINENKHETQVIIPPKVCHGPSLILAVDLVVSGGGTMNREAACLGMPVYSIFRGRLGSIDRHLIENGRLHLIEDAGALSRIELRKRTSRLSRDRTSNCNRTLDFVMRAVLDECQGRIG